MAKAENLQFGKELVKILNIYTENDFENEPLDSDGVDDLTSILHAQLELLNGNITEYQYNKLLDKNTTTFILCPVSTMNDSNVKYILLRINDDVRNKLKEFRSILDVANQSSLVFDNVVFDYNTTLITGDDNISSEQKEIINQLDERFDDEIVIDVSDIIDNTKFNLLHDDTRVNWNENVRINVARFDAIHTVYITNQFNSDFIEGYSIDFAEMEIFE